MHELLRELGDLARTAAHASEAANPDAEGSEKKAWAIQYAEQFVDSLLTEYGVGWAARFVNPLLDQLVEVAVAEINSILGGFPMMLFKGSGKSP